jgi:hypothetical protein
MQKHIDLLGWNAKDKVTGFTGVVEHIGVDLYGCVQALLRAPVVVDKSGEQKSAQVNWFDVSRLEKIGKRRVMEPIAPNGAKPPGGCDKPAK